MLNKTKVFICNKNNALLKCDINETCYHYGENMNTHALGIGGETEATKYLKKKGYKILERNYTTYVGEIDIICQKNGVIVFVEVKKRESLKFGYPREAVTPYKINKIRLVATEYLKTKRLSNQKIRFDVIDILEDKISHIENCF